MKKLLYHLSGYYRLTVSCPYPERVFNLCAQNGIELRSARRIDEQTVSGIVSKSDYKAFLACSKTAGFTVETVQKVGFPFFLHSMRKRVVLMTVTALSLCFLWISSLYIWDIRIVGNDTVSKAEILNALDAVGVRVGTNRLALNADELSNSVLMLLPKLSFITVNTTGSVTFVQVRERTQVPPMAQRDTPYSVVADKSGVITKMTVLAGRGLFSRGDTVEKGETLAVSDEKSGDKHARAEVYARTWYDATAVTEENCLEKRYTGRTKKRYSLIFGRNRLNLYINSGISYGSYDKIISVYKLGIKDILLLPVSVVTETYAEYEPTERTMERDALREETADYLRKALTESMESGAILSCDITDTEKDGVLSVRLNAECTEEIGREIPMR